MNKIGAELADQIAKHFESTEFKQLLDETKAASESDTGTFRVVGTSENLDRYQEVIKIDAWDTAHYLNNPVILWGHDHNRLIGMTTSIEIVDGKMVFNGKFAPTEEGQEKRRLYDLGFLRATSVGFIEKEREGNLITKAELLELSFVSVPANPYALTLAVQKELNINELVTKGIMFVEKADSTEDGDGQFPNAEEVAANQDEPAPVIEEKSFSAKQLMPVIDSLKAALVALEALGVKSEEPEGDDEPIGDDDEDAKSFAEFSAKRRLLQDASTVLGEVLAESRRAIEAKKAA